MADIDVPEPETLFDDYNTRGYGIKLQTQKIGENHTFYESETGHLLGQARKAAQYQSYIKKYLRCVASIDENVGRVLNYLDENNLTELFESETSGNIERSEESTGKIEDTKEPEMFEDSESEENFEIPAFLRRQKN